MSPRLFLMLVLLVSLQLSLQFFALRDLVRQPKVTGGNKWLWVPIIVLGGIIGALIYFAAGRKED